MRARRVRNSTEALAAFLEFTFHQAGADLARAKGLAQQRKVIGELINTLGVFAPALPDEMVQGEMYEFVRGLADDVSLDVPWKDRLAAGERS